MTKTSDKVKSEVILLYRLKNFLKPGRSFTLVTIFCTCPETCQCHQHSEEMKAKKCEVMFLYLQVLGTDSRLLRNISHYHFNGLGKAIRPNIVITAAKAFNSDSTAAYRCNFDR